MHVRSIRFKTTLLYSGILLAILIVYNIVLFFSVRSILMRDIDEKLRIKAGEIANVFQAYEKIKDISAHPLSMLENLLQEQGVLPNRAVIIDELWRSEFETLRLKEDYINILVSTGQTLIHSNNVTEELRGLIAAQFGFSNAKIYFGNVKNKIFSLRAVNLPFLYKQNLPLTIQVATPLAPAYRFLAKLMLISSVCIVIIIALTSFLGSFFVRRILAPVVTVTKTANNISHMDLGTRITGQAADIEMKQLITSFNAMIGRLEKSFTHINEFNSYVAHELKTPLAIVRGELELAIEQAQEQDENRKILAGCLEEIDRMIRITKDLLLLTKLDYNPQVFKFEKIDFGKFLEEIKEHGRILASDKQIAFTSDGHRPPEGLVINGDKVHLRRLFLNILTNAIKFTPAGGNISLSMSRFRNEVYVDIVDTGVGISQEHLQKIFDKFFRVDRGETTADAGVGLGLSIALSIAKAHQGDIRVKSRLQEGTTFTVILPLST